MGHSSLMVRCTCGRWLRTGTFALLGVGLPACSFPDYGIQEPPPKGEEPRPEVPCGPPACREGELRCNGDRVEECVTVACVGYSETWNCAKFGARCDSSVSDPGMQGRHMCVFDQPCPADTDRFCRGDYLLTCDGGAIVDVRSCAPCTQVRLANGRHAAACKAPTDEVCASAAPLSEECHGTQTLACEYGIPVTFPHDCAPGRCMTFTTPDGVRADCF